jgi:hypothetical protein
MSYAGAEWARKALWPGTERVQYHRWLRAGRCPVCGSEPAGWTEQQPGIPQHECRSCWAHCPLRRARVLRRTRNQDLRRA